MSKKQHWKKSVRAEVAAALQGKPMPIAQPSVTSVATSSTTTQKSTPTLTSYNEALLYHPAKELWRIFWVAGFLLVILIVAAITDNQSHWLDTVAQKISDRL